ncbi:MAG TPA: cyclic nucleotide-binding domain-containing protein [Spirochaetota bacterium]|nr:cyclic nucleotide-binding domain-containing protein [Spirochaetota bacterium]
MDIRKAGWRLFSIRQDEFGYAVPLFALYLLSGCFYATGQIFTETIFLKTYGAPGLSRFFVYNGIALIAGGLMYNLFLLKVSLRRGYLVLIVLFTGLITAALLERFRGEKWLPFALYMGNYLFTFFLDMHFFNFIFRYLSLRNSRRIIPFLMGGGKLGGILAGGLIFGLLSDDVAQLGIILWASCGALMLVPLLALRPPAGGGGPEGRRESELLPDMRIVEKLVRKVRVALRFPLFAWSILAVFAMSIANQIAEFYFAGIFNRVFTTGRELAAFLSAYTVGSDLLTLGLQLFVVSRVIRGAGVGRVNSVYPASFLGLVLLAAAWPGLAAGIMLRFFRKNLSILFRMPAFNIIMAASPSERMAEVKSFITGIISPLGMIAGGGCILLIHDYLAPGAGYALGAGVGAVYLGVTLFQNRAYLSSLRKRLSIGSAYANASALMPQDGLPPHGDDAGRVFIAEAFFNENPSVERAADLAPLYDGLSRETKEGMLDLFSSTRTEPFEAVIHRALGDGEPSVRIRALGLIAGRPLAERRRLIDTHLRPSLEGEWRAAMLILAGEGPVAATGLDPDSFALQSLHEIGAMVRARECDPVEFLALCRVLHPGYYLDRLVDLAVETRQIALFDAIIPHADSLTRSKARRVMYAFRDATPGRLADFFSMADALSEMDRASLLDLRPALSAAHITLLFQPDEKVRSTVFRRLASRKSFSQKYNYLNYLVSIGVPAVKEMESFLDYEIDTIVRLKRLRSSIEGAPENDTAGTLLEFINMTLTDTVELHKHLMLKALGAITGADLDRLYESSLLLRDRELDEYLLEYIDASGKAGKRALAVLEDAGRSADTSGAKTGHTTAEMLWAVSEKNRQFLPEIRDAMRHCATVLSRGEAQNAESTREAEMDSLIEKIVFLKKNVLFRDLKVNELIRIAAITREIDLAADRTVIAEGDMGDELFMVYEGEVLVHTGGRTLDRLGAGDCLGELSIIDREPRSASAVTTKPSRLLAIRREDFLLTLKENPSISISVMQVITRRLRKMIAS